MIRWHIQEKAYRTWLLFCIGTREELIDLLKECEYTDIEDIAADGASGMCIELTPENNGLGNDCFLVWLPEWNAATLVHEITHLVMFVFRRCSIPMEIENTEPFAFLSEFYWTEINRIRRRKPKGQTPAEARK